jgi:hypothetical protein
MLLEPSEIEINYGRHFYEDHGIKYREYRALFYEGH